MRPAPGFWWSLLRRLLGIAVGVLLLASPLSGAISLTIVLVVFFIIEGGASIMFALDHKRELSGQWGWMLVSGIIDLVLAALIFAGLPSTAAWAIGLLVGINMVFGGMALIAMALHARSAAYTALGRSSTSPASASASLARQSARLSRKVKAESASRATDDHQAGEIGRLKKIK